MKHWVFDLDGTLINSHEPYFTNLIEVCGDYKIKLTDEDLKKSLRVNAIDFLKDHVPAQSLEIAFEKLIKLGLASIQHIPVYEGVEDYLAYLTENKVTLSLWTAREGITAREVIKTTKLEKYFSHTITGSCVTVNKPSPEGLTKILRHRNCNGNEAIMIGDSEHDVQGAKAAGVKSVSVSWDIE
ncbi:MAG: HAD-IA family hydrolase, partial [Bdellovibrionota bacterium]